MGNAFSSDDTEKRRKARQIEDPPPPRFPLYASGVQNFGSGPQTNAYIDQQYLAAENIDNALIDFGDWCKDNPLQCALSTLDFIPVAGTLARCGQLVVQGLDNDLGEDTAFNCELNAAGDLIPVAGKALAKGASKAFKAASQVARGTKAADTLRVAKTAAAAEGLSKAEKEAARIKLGEAGEAYTKVVASETARIGDEIAEEALEMEAHSAAIAEKRAAQMEERAALKAARETEVRALLKVAQAESKAEVKLAGKAEARLAEKAEADAADDAARRRGARENAAKDAKAKPKKSGLAEPKKSGVGSKLALRLVAEAAAQPFLSVLNCREDFLAGDTFHDGDPLYLRLHPSCKKDEPDSEDDEPTSEEDEPILVPPPAPALHPDLWPALNRPTTAAEAGFDATGLYLLGILVVAGAGTYAYYKF